jgi:predicted double-glycine peptidase
MVMIAIDDGNVSVYDPMLGKRKLNRTVFDQAWGLTNGLTILVVDLI